MDIDSDAIYSIEHSINTIPGCNMTSQQEKYELVLYIMPSCPYCMRVVAYLQSIHKKIKTVDIRKVPGAKEHLIKVGGKKQVPCLFINGVPLYESKDIITWLDNHQNEY